jgi:hypothetical protein
MSTKYLRPARITSRRKAPSVAVAGVAITIGAQLAGSSPASALPPAPLHPPCTNNWVAYGPVTIDHSDGVTVRLNWNGKQADSRPDGATLFLKDGTPAQVDDKGHPVQHGGNKLFDSYHSDQTGTASGGINGSNIDFNIVWVSTKPVSTNHYTGSINQDGYASGKVTNSGNNITTSWHMEAAFACGG